MTYQDRHIYWVSGQDALPFLQGVLSNSVMSLQGADGLLWAALLNPQGKYLSDMFIGRVQGQLICDLSSAQAEASIRRLTMYRLRADVQFLLQDWGMVAGVGTVPNGAFADPRHPALGWRIYGPKNQLPALQAVDWDMLRVQHLIPQAGIELIENDSYLLEMGFERLHGVDFRKGCYVGQEVTARMKHKTELRKGLARVALSGPVPLGTAIENEGKEVGRIYTQAGGYALAYLRFGRTSELMQAAGQTVTLAPQPNLD